MSDVYDELPWDGAPDPLAHPSALAVTALVDGREPPPTDRCRVLAIGCAEAADLLPLAARWPGAQLVGLERSTRQAETARSHARELGLTNLRIVEADLVEAGAEALGGPFDYVLASGLLSWIPAPSVAPLMALIASSLAPSGVAYVTYNARPGWGLRAELAATMRAFAGGTSGRAAVRAARGALETLRDLLEASGVESPYARLLREEVETARGFPDGYLAHEYLSPDNRAYSLAEVDALAEGHGLRRVAELARASADGIREHVVLDGLLSAGADPASARSATDLLLGRQFRRSVLTRRTPPSPPASLASVLERLHLRARLRGPEDPVPLEEGVAARFETESDATLRVDGALQKATLVELTAHPHAARSMEAIRAGSRRRLAEAGVVLPSPVEAERALVEGLSALLRAGHLRAYLEPLGVDEPPPERASTTALARFEARHRGRLTDPFQEATALHDVERAAVEALSTPAAADELAERLGVPRDVGRELILRLHRAGALRPEGAQEGGAPRVEG